MTNFKVGEVTHYFDKISVAIITLSGELTTGEKIKFSRGGEDLYEQDVDSIQVEHNKIEKAKKGDVVGLKVIKPLKEGTEVFKVS